MLLLEWQGWRLLFTGDAEKRSWRTMDKQGMVGPVHFLKVSHHGSSTGLPPAEILDKLLPKTPPPAKRGRGAVSTYPNTYPGVPDKDTLDRLARADRRALDPGPRPRQAVPRVPVPVEGTRRDGSAGSRQATDQVAHVRVQWRA